MTTKAAPRPPRPPRPPWRSWLTVQTFESVALVSGLTLVNLLWFRDDPGFVSVTPHPSLFLVLLITLRYGLRAGAVGAAMATVAHAILLLCLVDVPTTSHLLQAPYTTPIAILVPVTVACGLLVDRHLKRLAAAEATRAAIVDENERLKQAQAELRDVNVELAGKVVGASGTLAALYRYSKELNVTEVDQIYAGLTKLLGEVLAAEAVSVWIVTTHGTTLAARSGSGLERLPAIEPAVAHHFDAAGVLSIHDVPEEVRPPRFPYLVGRILEGPGGALVAYLAIERLPFERYTPETIRLFGLVVDWATTSVGNALSFRRLSASKVGPVPGAPKSPARPVRGPVLPDARERTGVRTALAEADHHLRTPGRGRTVPPPAPPEEMRDELLRATQHNLPLGELLGQIARYIEEEPPTRRGGGGRR